MITPLIGMPQGAEWLVILAIIVIVFGAAKLPELARGTGQALRIFKAETKGLIDDGDDKDKTKDATASAEPTQTPVAKPAELPATPPEQTVTVEQAEKQA